MMCYTQRDLKNSRRPLLNVVLSSPLLLFFTAVVLCCVTPITLAAPTEKSSENKSEKTEEPKTEKEKGLIQNPKKTWQQIHEGQAFGIAIENDSRRVGGPGVDQAYSNGVKLSYVYARDKVPSWMPLSMIESPFLRNEIAHSKSNFGVSLNHQIYTPNNTTVATLIPNDRPYAAWLSLAFSLHLKNTARSQTLEASFGAIGPAAMGESVQNGFHKLIGSPSNEGWAHQLKNEPAVQISYQQRQQFLELRNKYGPYFDLIPMAGGGLGNIFVGIHGGMLARLGLNLPADFGPARPSGGETDSFVSPNAPPDDLKSSYYLFAGIRGNGIARNIFLDGNTFQASHHVKKYPFTFETEVGLGVQIMPVSFVWRFVVKSPEFEENSGFNSFASIGITYFTR